MLLQWVCPVHQMPVLLVETVPQGRPIAEMGQSPGKQALNTLEGDVDL